jgi:threonine dehydratase
MPAKRAVELELGRLAGSVDEAAARLEGLVARTPLQRSKRLSDRFDADIHLKREDLQEVRSFKIRGALNKIRSLSDAERHRGVVCASAGNHAQGVAQACSLDRIKGTVFMPTATPLQKVDRVRHFGGGQVTVKLVGQTYDEAGEAANRHAKETGAVLVHPFDDPVTIAGQGTVGKEIAEEMSDDLDCVIATIGGGGLVSGIASYLKHCRPEVRVVGAEPCGAAGMQRSLLAGRAICLDEIDTFVDGAAVKRVGDLTFELCRRYLDGVVLVPEGQACTTLIELYQNEGIVAELAGALTVAALDDLSAQIRGKTVVCVVSGGNNDLLRYPEILERSLIHQGRKHYFIVEFAQKPGQLRRFVDEALGPRDDIVRFEYMKKTNKERGAALVGIELQDSRDLEPLLRRMGEIQLEYRQLTADELLYDYLV